MCHTLADFRKPLVSLFPFNNHALRCVSLLPEIPVSYTVSGSKCLAGIDTFARQWVRSVLDFTDLSSFDKNNACIWRHSHVCLLLTYSYQQTFGACVYTYMGVGVNIFFTNHYLYLFICCLCSAHSSVSRSGTTMIQLNMWVDKTLLVFCSISYC